MYYEKEIQEVIDQARVIKTVKELAEIYDKRIEEYSNSKWFKNCVLKVKEEKERALERFAKGEVVCWLVSYDHFGHGLWGEDTETYLYTDGTYKVTRHTSD